MGGTLLCAPRLLCMMIDETPRDRHPVVWLEPKERDDDDEPKPKKPQEPGRPNCFSWTVQTLPAYHASTWTGDKQRRQERW